MKKWDVVIILGGATDGTLTPVLYTKERLEFLKKRRSLLKLPIIASGGYPSTFLRKPRYTEADVMRNFLLASGVPKRNIYVEKRSRDTIGNAIYSKQIVKKHPRWKNILIVTSKGHVPRSRWVFKTIFGEGYVLGILGAPSNVGTLGKNPDGRKKYENYIIQLYREGFESIKLMTDKAIIKAMRRFQTGYSNDEEALKFKEKVREAKKKFLK